jgi:glucose-fructose oxidoreductase
VLPAFKNAAGARLGAIVSGDRAKLASLGDEYGVERRATYDEYETLLKSGAIDAVYIALPNDQHRSYAVRAAEAGVHVLCEKPLAITVEDCRAMIDAANANKVKLMTAYRLHFEATNQQAIEAVRSGRIGDPRMFESAFSFQVNAPNLRLEAQHGGGTLWDIGVYCINAARHAFGAEPIEVSARSFNNGEPRFREVDEMTSVIMRFPGEKTATFTTSFGAESTAYFRVIGTKGTVHVEPAFGYRGELGWSLASGGKTEHFKNGPADQFAPELSHHARCIREDLPVGPDGEEGLKDVKVVLAALRSAATGTTSNV